MGETLPTRGDTLLFDTLVYSGIIVMAYGIGSQLDSWMANASYLQPVLYTAILVLVYAKWVLPPHRD